MSCGSINILHTLDANSLTSLLLGFPFSSNESASCQTYLTIGFNIFFFTKIQSNLKKKNTKRTLCVMHVEMAGLSRTLSYLCFSYESSCGSGNLISSDKNNFEL